MEGRGGVVHRHPPLIDPFPELADVIVVIQHHLKITMTVAKTQKLNWALTEEYIRRRHIERFDLIKRIEDGIR